MIVIYREKLSTTTWLCRGTNCTVTFLTLQLLFIPLGRHSVSMLQNSTTVCELVARVILLSIQLCRNTAFLTLSVINQLPALHILVEISNRFFLLALGANLHVQNFITLLKEKPLRRGAFSKQLMLTVLHPRTQIAPDGSAQARNSIQASTACQTGPCPARSWRTCR